MQMLGTGIQGTALLRFTRWSRSKAAAFHSLSRSVSIGRLSVQVLCRLERKTVGILSAALPHWACFKSLTSVYSSTNYTPWLNRAMFISTYALLCPPTQHTSSSISIVDANDVAPYTHGGYLPYL